MTISQRFPRAIIATAVAAVLAVLGVVQAASMSFLREPGTLSSLIPVSFGRSVYAMLDRIAPAPFVEETLAEDALARGDLAQAEHHAVRLPPGGRRDDLLGRIAEARGDDVLAREYYFVAPDIDRMQRAIQRLAAHDPAAAYALEAAFSDRLAALQRHPDALAESYFIAGNLAQSMNRPRVALAQFERAASLAPLNMKYALNAANAAYFYVGDDAAAQRYYAQGVQINPASGDCLAGLGLVALRQGRRAEAEAYLARSRRVEPSAPLGVDLEKQLKQ